MGGGCGVGVGAVRMTRAGGDVKGTVGSGSVGRRRKGDGKGSGSINRAEIVEVCVYFDGVRNGNVMLGDRRSRGPCTSTACLLCNAVGISVSQVWRRDCKCLGGGFAF